MHFHKKVIRKRNYKRMDQMVNLPYKRLEFLGFQLDDKVIAAAGGNCYIANGNNLFFL